MINSDEELNPEEVGTLFAKDNDSLQFSNLILDELRIDHLTAEDKKFLEEFKNLELLSMNQTMVKST